MSDLWAWLEFLAKMDSIKHKMDTMIREKDAALAKAIAFEAEAKAGFPIDHDISLFHVIMNHHVIRKS